MKKSISIRRPAKPSFSVAALSLNVPVPKAPPVASNLLLLPLLSPVASAKLTLKAAKEAEKRAAFLKSEAKRKEAEARKAANKPEIKAEKFTRAEAFAVAIKNGPDFKSNLVSLSDSIYSLNGGKSNEKESAWYYNTIVPGLIALNFASYDREGRLTVFAFASAIAA